MSLVLDLSGLEKEVGWELKFSLSGEPPEPEPLDGVALGAIRVEGRALWTGETVLVEGRARARAELVCGRCLGKYQTQITGAFAREFRPDAGPVSAGHSDAGARRRRAAARDFDAEETAERAEEDGVEAPLPLVGDEVDLTLPAWEALVLELPMKPVCREDCRGLCPVCGTNLNERECGCRVEEADPRLEALKKLLEAKERSE